MSTQRRSVSEIFDLVETGSIDTIAGNVISQRDDIDGTRFVLADGSWAIIRFSGTEPLMRIYAESGSEKSVDHLISECRNLMDV